MAKNVYKTVLANGTFSYSANVPSNVDPALVELHNTTGTIVSTTNHAARLAFEKVKKETTEEEEEAEDQLTEDLNDAKASCNESLAGENQRRVGEANQWAADTKGFAEQAVEAVNAASDGLNNALAGNNAARFGQNLFSELSALVGSVLPGVQALGASVLSTATSVPALVGSPEGFLSEGQAAAQSTFNSTTGYLANRPGVVLGQVGQVGRSLLGANSHLGDLQSLVSAVKGPQVYELLGSLSTPELERFYDLLDGADLSFAEELFASDADELRGKIKEVLGARESAATNEGQAEHAEDQIDATEDLNEALTGTCVNKKMTPLRAAYNEGRAERAARRRAAAEKAEASFKLPGSSPPKG